MAKLPPIQLANIDDLYLDPKNPRLGRHETGKGLSQEEVLALLDDWSLEELAVSFLESGFWPQEALIVVREPLPNSTTPVLVVVEGNRRLAALGKLQQARTGHSESSKWNDYVKAATAEQLDQLTQAPYIEMPNRRSVQGYLGFRHVTGIKEWSPAEKAQFIAHLIEDEGLDYDQVRRRIGSKAPTVRQHYVAYKLLLQMEEETDTIDVSRVEERFSVLYRAVRASGVQKYLLMNPTAAPQHAVRPVPSERLEQLVKLTGWLFGTSRRPPCPRRLAGPSTISPECSKAKTESLTWSAALTLPWRAPSGQRASRNPRWPKAWSWPPTSSKRLLPSSTNSKASQRRACSRRCDDWARTPYSC